MATKPQPKPVFNPAISLKERQELNELRKLREEFVELRQEISDQKSKSTTSSKQKPVKNKSSEVDFNRTAWFVGGVIIASTLHAYTTLILVLCWVFVENKPLPSFLGGQLPLTILGNIIGYISSKFGRKKSDKSSGNEGLTIDTRVISDMITPQLTMPPIVFPFPFSMPTQRKNNDRVEEQD